MKKNIVLIQGALDIEINYLLSKMNNKVKKEIVKLLRIKYSLEIVSEDPLELKKIEYQLNSDTLFYNQFSKKLTENFKLCEFRWLVGLEINYYF